MVERMAHEIAERHKDLPGLAFIGIRTRGVPLATRLATQLSNLVKQSFPVGTLDITTSATRVVFSSRTPLMIVCP